MIKSLSISAISMFTALSAFAVTPESAVAQMRQAQQTESPEAQGDSDTEASRAMAWAREMGEIAGGATFCKMDPEVIENFILQALARIASEAHDDVDQVVSRITFNNTLDTSAIKEPKGGCDNFPEVFERELKRLD